MQKFNYSLPRGGYDGNTNGLEARKYRQHVPNFPQPLPQGQRRSLRNPRIEKYPNPMVRPNSRPSEFPNSYSLNELERHDQKQLRTNAAGPLPRNRFQRLENHSFKESFYPTHFPEYTEVQKDNYPRSRIQNFPHSRSQITPNNIPEIQPITMKSQRSRCRTPEELSNEIKTILQIQGPQDRAKDFQFRGRLMEKQKNGRMEAENPPLQFSNFQKRERPGLPVRPFYKAQYFQGEPKFEYTKHLKCIEMELRRLLGMICHLQTPGYNGRYL